MPSAWRATKEQGEVAVILRREGRHHEDPLRVRRLSGAPCDPARRCRPCASPRRGSTDRIGLLAGGKTAIALDVRIARQRSSLPCIFSKNLRKRLWYSCADFCPSRSHAVPALMASMPRSLVSRRPSSDHESCIFTSSPGLLWALVQWQNRLIFLARQDTWPSSVPYAGSCASVLGHLHEFIDGRNDRVIDDIFHKLHPSVNLEIILRQTFSYVRCFSAMMRLLPVYRCLSRSNILGTQSTGCTRL